MVFKYLVLSDIHLGHNINKTENIINHLELFFKEYRKEIEKVNMIILAGDVFDRLLTNNSLDFNLAIAWLTELIIYCKTRNIQLRILEGTPSHDWKQAKVVTTIIEKLKLEIDYKYIDTIYIERLDNGLTILYIPDEYKHTASGVYTDVKKLIKENKLTEVDIAIMHGQFKYQLPEHLDLKSSHIEEDYLSIVKHYISIGHIHTGSVYNRIIAQGSFDRLAHNEEEDKGGVIITIDTNKGNSYKLLVNKHATIFKTVKFKDEVNIEKMLKELNSIVNKLPENSNVRIITTNDKFTPNLLTSLRNNFNKVNIKIENKEVKKEKIIDKVMTLDTFSITKENIVELLDQEVINVFNKVEMEIYRQELNKVV